MIKYIRILIALSSLGVVFVNSGIWAQESAGLSLDECLKIAAQNNRQALIAAEGANQAEGKLAEARARLYPTINTNLTYYRVDEIQSFEISPGRKMEIGSLNTYRGELSVRQSVYMGGRVRSGIHAAEIGQLMQSTQETDLRRGLNFQVRKSYYDVLLQEETFRVNLKTEEVIKAHLDDVVKMNREGLVSDYDVLRAKVQLSGVRALRIQSRSTLERARLALVNVLGLPLENANGLSLSNKMDYSESASDSLAGAEETALGNRPDLRSAQLRVDVQREALKMAKAERLPTLSLVGAYGEEKPSRKVFGGVEWGNYWNLTALVTIPMFEGGRVKARVKQETSALQQAEMLMNDIRERVRYELAQVVLMVKDAQALIVSQKDNVKQAEEGLRIVKIGYKSGVNTQLEVMDAQMALDTASKNYIMALYQYNLALANLEMVIGK